MLTSLYSGLSGLNANATELSLIGNNLANVNTPGYKTSTGAFQDLLSQILTGGSSQGNINYLQIGLGTKVTATNQNFSQGSLESTGINTNVAIQGDGLFVVDSGQGPSYTRAGDFHVDANGDLVTADGANVLGYTQIDPVTNQIIPSGALANIHIAPGTLFPPIPTTAGQVIANLDANAANASTLTSSVRVYDSLGSPHQVDITFTRTGAGAYDYDVFVEGGEVTGGTAGTPFSILAAPGTLGFDAAGLLIDVDGAAAADVTLTTPTFTNGAAALTFDWTLLNPAGGFNVTNFAAPSATSSSSQNGFPAGTLASIVVGNDGTIQGAFSNGQAAELARLALATFANPGGLIKIGSNRFNASIASGDPNVGGPSTGGRGSVAGSTLELSNVDMAAEFINMIVAQRGYQANSKVITTTDEILQEAINLKR